MAKKPEEEITALPGEGDVPITLDGEELVLRPSLGACLSLSRMNGGVRNTLNRVMSLDVDTIVKVVAAGLGRPVTKDLQEAVYRSGLFLVATPVMRFITVINNGGRPPVETDDDNTEGTDDTENPPLDDLPL